MSEDRAGEIGELLGRSIHIWTTLAFEVATIYSRPPRIALSAKVSAVLLRREAQRLTRVHANQRATR